MSELYIKLSNIDTSGTAEKRQVLDEIVHHMSHHGYTVTELDDQRPWGGFLRLDDAEADSFIEDFFEGLSPSDVRLGNDDAELSPKILLVAPGQRLSWQYHERRAEIWSFLTGGHHHKSVTDEQGDVNDVEPGEVVQFLPQERHRLVGQSAMYTVVAEIWQHSDCDHLSDEDDIIRLADDYSR